MTEINGFTESNQSRVTIVRRGCGQSVQVSDSAGWRVQTVELALMILERPSSVLHRRLEMQRCGERQAKVSVVRPVSCPKSFGHRCYF